MVALLWAEGNYAAAVRVEELWNDLQKTYSFSLFCAYPINAFTGERFAEPLTGVCTAHSSVIPAESYADLVNHDDRLRAIIQLQQKAKTLQAEIRRREDAQEKLKASLVREQMARAEAESANRHHLEERPHRTLVGELELSGDNQDHNSTQHSL